jgi:hypothetical protein
VVAPCIVAPIFWPAVVASAILVRLAIQPFHRGGTSFESPLEFGSGKEYSRPFLINPHFFGDEAAKASGLQSCEAW